MGGRVFMVERSRQDREMGGWKEENIIEIGNGDGFVTEIDGAGGLCR